MSSGVQELATRLTDDELGTGGAGGTQAAAETVTVIERRTGWRTLDLRDVWRHRELLYFLTWRDVKIRYKQSVFGAGWAILRPVLQMLVFSVFFGRFVGLNQETGGVPYPVFVFAGLLPWTLFSSTLLSAGNSIVSNRHIITKIYFPRLIIPVSSAGVAVVDFAISLVVLLAMMAWYGIAPGPEIVLFPVLTALIVMTSLMVGIWVSALAVQYRDFQYVVPFAVQLWMYLTPVIYPVSIVPERYRWLIALNPMTGLTDAFRYSLLGQPFAWSSLWLATAMAAVGIVTAIVYFRRVESTFADVV